MPDPAQEPSVPLYAVRKLFLALQTGCMVPLHGKYYRVTREPHTMKDLRDGSTLDVILLERSAGYHFTLSLDELIADLVRGPLPSRSS